MSIWHKTQGINFCKPLTLEPWRIVEAQHISSTRDLVDSREEHDILETLLEHSKPKISSSQHYLILTPFRYPPLQYGSRFGNAYESSLWYGSLSLETAFAEVAFYRLKFFEESSANLGYIEIPMTLFKAYIKTGKGIDLTKSPFKKYQEKISHPTSYEYSQELGTEMREGGVEAFIFTSARDKDSGKNIGLFIPSVFKMKNNQYVTDVQNWRCIASQHSIEFSRDEFFCKKHLEFYKNQFASL